MADSDAASTTPRARDRGRRHDILLWGATGYTGKLVAEYLLRNYGDSDLRWALGGRNRGKLESVRAELSAIDSRASELPIVVGDSHDASSLGRIAADSEVVCTTVGPYFKYGSGLVAACVEHGTDYCDLTGEVTWVRRMIDAHHDAARKSGARIVNFCGFDSIPADLGTLLLQDAAKTEGGASCSSVGAYVGPLRGGLSGGTVASMMTFFEQAKRDPSLRRVAAHPYALNPEGERSGPDGRDPMAVEHDELIGAWTAPFLMASVNTRVVRRSNALLDYSYGRDFRYREVMRCASGPKGMLQAGQTMAMLAGLAGGLSLQPTRELLRRFVLPAPGQGPSRESREGGCFRYTFIGRRDDGSELRARVSGDQDPGYAETSKMLAESAMCLALEGAELGSGGGILTPASCMGMRLVERLRRAGMVLAVQ